MPFLPNQQLLKQEVLLEMGDQMNSACFYSLPLRGGATQNRENTWDVLVTKQ
jgi:hypothetical protein